MDAMILAAGHGTRLRPLTYHTPKILIEIHGQSLLDRHVQQLHRAGVKRIIVNTHGHHEKLQAAIASYQQRGIDVSLSYESELLGTGGGIKKALVQLASRGPFILVSSDIYANPPFEALMLKHQHAPEIGTMLVQSVANQSIPANAYLTSNCSRLQVQGKPEDGVVYRGIACLPSDWFVKTKADNFRIWQDCLLGRVKAAEIDGLPITAPHIDIGTHQALAQARHAALTIQRNW